MPPKRENEELDAAIGRAASLLHAAHRVAVLTGAGVSAESGLATFRGGGGLWEGHRVEEVATPSAFQRDPVLVWRFYNARRAALRAAKPNPGHQALVALENHYGSEHFAIATQNVDGLHQTAGSLHVLELHGSLSRVRCTGCNRIEDRGTEPLDELPHCRRCNSLLRPGVVWFGESLPEEIWQQAQRAVRECDCLLVVGTSAIVYPAAGLIDYAPRVIEINLDRTEASGRVTESICGPSGQILPRLVERMKW